MHVCVCVCACWVGYLLARATRSAEARRRPQTHDNENEVLELLQVGRAARARAARAADSACASQELHSFIGQAASDSSLGATLINYKVCCAVRGVSSLAFTLAAARSSTR